MKRTVMMMALIGVAAATPAPAQSTTAMTLHGVVSSTQGAEAGVWVIAETDELPTRFARIVVTDEQGRYLLPDLPAASYRIWVRGYGLIDSPKQTVRPGRRLDLRAVIAPDARAAAEVYPAIYWYSMLKVPPKHAFPGTGPSGNGIPVTLKTQGHWLDVIKTNGCYTCHQLGNKATRSIPPEFSHNRSSVDAWRRRLQAGQAMTPMNINLGKLDRERALQYFAEWTDRIAAGEVPAARPQRPQGIERNLVLTLWDWATPKAYLHDAVSTDKRNPRVNADGRIYGATEESSDEFAVLDPRAHRAWMVKMPVRDANTQSSRSYPLTPSVYWGDETIWSSQASMHNPMFDELGRVWFTSRVGQPPNPDFCRKGSSHPSAQLTPLESSTRHLSRYDPPSGKITLIRTCFPTHHLVFAEDADDTLWLSAGAAGNGVIGWFKRRVFDATGDEAKAQGWTALILDTNGNGRRDDYVEADQPLDPARDKRVLAGFYGVAVNPRDGTVWGSVLGMPGYVIRLNPGANPPATALAEVFEPPFPGYGPRGMDIDRNGVVWTPLSSGHLASFDRRKCRGPLNGPAATGKHCPEGWTLTAFPGPQLGNVSDSGSAEASYYTWVDQFDTFGLGRDTPFATGNANESLLARVDGKWINLRVPYPQGFYAKWMDGRIDDAAAGWKGRALWTTTGNRTPFHLEGGKGTRPKVVKFQLRPHPLAN